MSGQDVRNDTNFEFTIEQIGRLERALMSVRESPVVSQEALDTIALVQYQEIVRLRTELDAALGFDSEKAGDLVIALHGPYVGIGTVPSSIISAILNDVYGAVRSVSSYLIRGYQGESGRYPSWLSQSADFDFAGVSKGSVRIRLNLPKPQTLFADDDRKLIERSVRLILDTIDWLTTGDCIDDFGQSVEDERLERLLITRIRRMVPSRNGIVQRIGFSGRLARPEGNYILSHSSADRIRNAFYKSSSGTRRVVEEGKLRAVDIDRGVFSLRQRPGDKSDLPCRISGEILFHALEHLVRQDTVIVEGVRQYDEWGKPTQLEVEDLYEKTS